MKNKKILVIGKHNHLGWIEHTINGFLSNGCEVNHFYTNKLAVKNTIIKGIYKTLGNKKQEISLQMNELNTKIEEFKPDIAVFVGAFFTNIELFALCKEKNIITIGWVGDKFSNQKSEYSKFIDYLFVSDSAFLDIAKQLDFKDVDLLQFGYDHTLHTNKNLKRENAINFVGSYTKDRDVTFQHIDNYNLKIYGTKWDKLSHVSPSWNISNKKISQPDVVNIYNSTLATLNVAQKENIINMVNMRTFEATACGSLLVNDYVKDLELCFEPNKEVLVYKNLDELENIIDRILHDPFLAKAIANNGEKRVKKSSYSYKDRTVKILNKL